MQTSVTTSGGWSTAAPEGSPSPVPSRAGRRSSWRTTSCSRRHGRAPGCGPRGGATGLRRRGGLLVRHAGASVPHHDPGGGGAGPAARGRCVRGPAGGLRARRRVRRDRHRLPRGDPGARMARSDGSPPAGPGSPPISGWGSCRSPSSVRETCWRNTGRSKRLRSRCGSVRPSRPATVRPRRNGRRPCGSGWPGASGRRRWPTRALRSGSGSSGSSTYRAGWRRVRVGVRRGGGLAGDRGGLDRAVGRDGATPDRAVRVRRGGRIGGRVAHDGRTGPTRAPCPGSAHDAADAGRGPTAPVHPRASSAYGTRRSTASRSRCMRGRPASSGCRRRRSEWPSRSSGPPGSSAPLRWDRRRRG